MRKQYKFHAQVGFSEDDLKATGLSLELLEILLVRPVASVCGGCASSVTNGWWCDDGATHKDKFDGVLNKEITINLEVSCEPHKEQQTIEAIKQGCAILKHRAQLPIQWVHLSKSEFIGMHFDVGKVAVQNGTDAQKLVDSGIAIQ